MPIAKVNKVNIYYEIHGEGEPLLMIAGLGSDSQEWQYVIGNISRHFQTIIFDNRGCGRSDTPDAPYTIKEMAKDTVELLDYLRISSCHILGHSMGGYIAQEIAISYPEKVYKLILESTAPVSSARNNDLFMNLYKEWDSGYNMNLLVEHFLYWILTPSSFENRKFLQSLLKFRVNYPYAQKKVGFLGQIEAIKSFNTIENLHRIHAETLIIIGEEDILIRPREADMLYEGITRASYPNYIEKAAHSIHTETPKAFTNAVLGFLYKYVR